MSTTDNNSSLNRDFQKHFSSDRNLGKDLKDDKREPDNNNAEIAERGYTVRNGYNPNGPNPDQEDYMSDDDLDDLNDDFHNDRDLEDNNDDIFEVELENDNLEEERDELDNPSDATENDLDFNETEDVLEDLDEDEEEDESEYIEDDVQEDNDDEEYPENDPRRL